MKPTHCLGSALLLALAVSAASCSKQKLTAPADAPAALSSKTRSGLGTVESALASPAWRSLDALKFAEDPARATASVRALLRDAAAQAGVLAGTATTSGVLADVSQELASRVAGPLAVVIPPDVRGTTYVFDLERHRYVADPTREGAPQDGVRYILYAVNPLTGEPRVSEEIGHADLTDEGDDTPNAASLRLQAVSDGITFVDYTVALAGAPHAMELTVNGTFFDRSKHLEFAIRAHAEATEVRQSLALQFQLAVPEDEFALANQARAVATRADSTVHAEQAVHIDATTFAISSVHGPDRVDATVGVNGVPFAVIHGRTGTLVVVSPAGDPLSDEERVALGRLMGLFDGVSRILGQLLGPVAALFALVPRA